MKTRTLDTPVHTLIRLALASALLTAMPTPSLAQVPVDDQGRLIGDYESSHETAGQTGEEGIPLLSAAELETLVGPVALYPDDLLAIVLPAATYPLQLVEAQRVLDAADLPHGLGRDRAAHDQGQHLPGPHGPVLGLAAARRSAARGCG